MVQAFNYQSPYSIAAATSPAYDYGLSSPINQGGIQPDSSIYGGSGVGQLFGGSGSDNLESSSPITDLPFSSFGKGGFVTKGIDTIGANIGFGPGSSVVSAVGPVQPVANAGTLTGASLSSVAGAGAIGAIGGNYLNKILGGNQTTGSIGGGAGAAIGMAVGGPAGAFVGGTLGSVVGGLFGGNEPPDMTMAGGINLATGKVNREYELNESSTGDKYNQQYADAARSVERGIGSFTQFLQQNGAAPILGPNGEQTEIATAIGGRDGLRIFTRTAGRPMERIPVQNHQNFQNFGQDFAAYSNGIVNTVLQTYDIPDELRVQIEQMQANGQLDDITQFGQSAQTQQGFAGMLGQVPLIAGRNDMNAPESFKDFLGRYRSTGDVNPRYGSEDGSGNS